jgi:hypothetical protein
MIGKTALAEYAKLTAERETLNQRQLAAGTAGAAVTQGAGYGAVTGRAAVLKSVVSKPPFGVRFRLGRVNRTAAHPTVFLYAVSVGGWGIYKIVGFIFSPNKLELFMPHTTVERHYKLLPGKNQFLKNEFQLVDCLQ